MTKGKSHSRGARTDIMRANERNLRRRARQQKAIQHPARIHDLKYNRQAYDGSGTGNSEPPILSQKQNPQA